MVTFKHAVRWGGGPSKCQLQYASYIRQQTSNLNHHKQHNYLSAFFSSSSAAGLAATLVLSAPVSLTPSEGLEPVLGLSPVVGLSTTSSFFSATSTASDAPQAAI